MDIRSLDLTPGMWTRSQEIIRYDGKGFEVDAEFTTVALHSEHLWQDIQTFVDLGIFDSPMSRRAGTQVCLPGRTKSGHQAVIWWKRDRKPAPEGWGSPGATVRA